MVTLLEIPMNVQAHIVQIQEKARLKLLQYGLHTGDPVRVLRVAPLDGPLLIDVNSREIALGREIAKKIYVEVE